MKLGKFTVVLRKNLGQQEHQKQKREAQEAQELCSLCLLVATGLRCYSEDPPDSAIEDEGMLSAIQEVTDNTRLAARAIHRNYFIV